MRFKLFALYIIILLILTGCMAIKTDNSSSVKPDLTMEGKQKIIKINNNELQVEVVKTFADMVKGLSGRQELCENCGMLFEYPDQQIRNFHMQGMNFPLDIIWIKDKVIVEIEENVPVLTGDKITRVQSTEKINRVLEVNAGWAKGHNIKIGALIGGLD